MKECKWLIYVLIATFLFGCGSNPPGPQKPEGPKGGNEPVRIHIPDRKEAAPPGILEQLSWAGLGGGDDEPEIKQKCGGCRVKLEGNRISFSSFQPSQELRVVIYRVTGREDCVYGTAEFVIMLPFRVDDRGNLSAELSGPTENLTVAFVLDAGTNDQIWIHPAASPEPLKCH